MGFSIAALVTPVQIFIGDVAAHEVFQHEPAKFAAIELLPKTGTHVPETLGGVLLNGERRYGLEIPSGASLLAGFSPSTRIAGLDTIPAAVRPAADLVSMVHLAFDVMVGIGFALLALSVWFAVVWWRRRAVPEGTWLLRGVAISGAAALVALECGWVVTEVGRQPWIVYNLMKVEEAATANTGVWLTFIAIVLLYVALGVTTIVVLRSMSRRFRRGGGFFDQDVPYGPTADKPPEAVEPVP